MSIVTGIKKFPTFLKEVKSEFKKVNWSSRQELKNSTIVVLIGAISLTTYIFCIDAVLAKLMEIFLK